MTIEEQVIEVAKKHDPDLELLREAMEELGCKNIIFWGRENASYEIEFKHEEKEYRITQ